MLQMLHVCGAKHYDCAAYLNAAADKTYYKFETRLTAAKLHIDQFGCRMQSATDLSKSLGDTAGECC